MNPGLEAICMKALSLEPEDRYKSILEMRRDIFNCLDGYPCKAEKPSLLRRALLFAKRKWTTLVLLTLAVLVALLAIILILHD